ncbi:IS1182 family transposase [Adhaeribacter radiodurans]|uniref:IS1182 family transposase n=1 Tax=Adhaeribacter radiodurans TaxID=2745197 RepID=A0A7L7L9H4_9BACT|nr:IS1182 family transposase [Adhaeribacter radiodurans]QMU29502.1 IS1182 family transposase [Adhaeribacter radiodurans]QMU30603.1 IS1182 family transposase [Adhaeribacter radiodurans]
MKFIQSSPRSQVPFSGASLEEAISAENEVRYIDAFVDALPLQKLGFRLAFTENGRPAYHPAILLKLFIYGYLNRIRSSRCLEKECHRNIEVMWLLGQLTPDHNTIANFRKNYPKAITQVFRTTVQMARHFQLIGGQLLAGDSTKLRAQNSKKNNYNQSKIARHLAYIENKLAGFTQALALVDNAAEREQITQAMTKHLQRQQYYRQLAQQLKNSGEEQVSTSDPESRQMIIRNTITEVAYNVQTTVDAKHCLPIDYQVTNHNDSKAMGNMLRRAKSIVGHSSFSALFDKGYHTGSELEIAQRLGIRTLVAIPAPAASAPDANYNLEHFAYDPARNVYVCPQQQVLTTNGSIYTKNRGYSNQTSFWQYRTRSCKSCLARIRCTTAKNGKLIERNVYSPVFEKNRANITANPELYKRRQAIVEHPFGTLKRQWGYSYVLSKKGIARASADVGLMLVAYNLRRLLHILGMQAVMAYIQARAALLIGSRTKVSVQLQRYMENITISLNCYFIYLKNTIFMKLSSRGY